MSTRAVILCGPVGEEADYAYASLRKFADRLACSGLSALRLDYRGLYNSLDVEEGCDPPAAWVQSIKAALRWLKDEAGIEDIVLVGLRFGAGLALKCAEELGGVDKLVLMAPVVSGVAYQRELSLLAKLSDGGSAVSSHDAPHKAATLFTAEQTFNVESLRCCQGDVRPARQILTLWESASSGGKRLADRLRSLGCEVIELRFEGYAELMTRPEWVQYPEAAFGNVLEWLREGVVVSDHEARGSPAAQRPHMRAELLPPGAREVAVEFDGERRLFGIECVPDCPGEGRPGVVFLNTSAVPHAGMNRMWVSTARRLALIGFTSLRFDLTGVGDSPGTAPVGPPRIEAACDDVAAAVTYLRGIGCSTITLIGFCWGAQLAYSAALADDRVTNLIIINARRQFWDPSTDDESLQTFSTHLRLLRDPEKWKSLKNGNVSARELFEFVWHLIVSGFKAVYNRLSNAETIRMKTVKKWHALRDRGTKSFLAHGNDDTFLAEFEDYFGVGRHKLGALLSIHTYFFPGVHHRFPNQRRLAELVRVVGDYLSCVTVDA